jgi:hypothetical protein
MNKAISGALGAVLLMLAMPSVAHAASSVPQAAPAPAHVTEAAWVVRCHTVWVRRHWHHHHHHHGWRRVPVRSCHRVHI